MRALSLVLLCASCSSRALDVPSSPFAPTDAGASFDLASSDLAQAETDTCAGAPPFVAPPPLMLPAVTPIAATATSCGHVTEADAIMPTWSSTFQVPSFVDAYGAFGPWVDDAGVVTIAQWYDPGGQLARYDANGNLIAMRSEAQALLGIGELFYYYDHKALALVAIDEHGNEALRVSLVSLFTPIFGSVHPYRLGAAYERASGRLVLTLPSLPGTVVALDAKSGAIAWTRTLGGAVDTVVSDGDGFYVDDYTQTTRCLQAFDPDGNVRWRQHLDPSLYPIADPAISDGWLLGFDHVARSTADGAGTFSAELDQPVISHGIAYANDTGGIVAVDLAHATALWRVFEQDAFGIWDGPQIAADGSILVAMQLSDGTAHAQLWSVGPDGSGRWQCMLSTYAGSILLAAPHVYAFDGTTLDRFEPAGAPALATQGWVMSGGGPATQNHPL